MSESDQSNPIIEAASFERAEASARRPLFVLSPVKTALLVLFLLLATAALFMFNARAVFFNFNPATDSLEFTSG